MRAVYCLFPVFEVGGYFTIHMGVTVNSSICCKIEVLTALVGCFAVQVQSASTAYCYLLEAISLFHRMRRLTILYFWGRTLCCAPTRPKVAPASNCNPNPKPHPTGLVCVARGHKLGAVRALCERNVLIGSVER